MEDRNRYVMLLIAAIQLQLGLWAFRFIYFDRICQNQVCNGSLMTSHFSPLCFFSLISVFDIVRPRWWNSVPMSCVPMARLGRVWHGGTKMVGVGRGEVGWHVNIHAHFTLRTLHWSKVDFLLMMSRVGGGWDVNVHVHVALRMWHWGCGVEDATLTMIHRGCYVEDVSLRMKCANPTYISGGCWKLQSMGQWV